MFASKDLFFTNNSGAYQISRSVRLRSSASAYFTRTFGSPTNNLKWTWSTWVKRGALGSNYYIFQAYQNATNRTPLQFVPGDNLQMYYQSGGVVIWQVVSNAVYRDPSSWYHIQVAFDSTQATASDRLKIYVNGSQITFSSASYPSLNQSTQVDLSYAHYIGAEIGSPLYFDGYMTEINFIDGQALTPSSFGSTNATTGVWQPAKYTGTYGTNGFYLPFTDNSALTTSSNVGLGKDFSGNGNYWTTNNISITAGVNYDSMTDVPTLTSASNANFCTLNQLRKGTGTTLSAANLTWSITLNNTVAGTIGVSSGKWYWEVTAGNNPYTGIINEFASVQNQLAGINGGYCYSGVNGQKYSNSISAAYGATYTSGDIIGVALDMDAGTLTFYKNNVSQGIAYSSLTGTYFAAVGSDSASTTTGSINFGQQPFSFSPPSGYTALNTYNLPASTITNGVGYMNAILQSGSAVNTGANLFAQSGFTYGMVWGKDRTSVNNHQLVDTVRGTSNVLQSNTTSAETTYTAPTSGDACVAWGWNASNTSSSNTNGSITSTVSVNATAGFSVVSYTGNATAGATVGHGLGVAPSMIIVKDRTVATSWSVYHISIGATNWILLNSTNAQTTSAQEWNNTAPTSTVFTVGNASSNSNQANPNIAYCWSQVAGYSKFGSYTGNGSADGPFVYCGFRPRFILVKNASLAGSNWCIEDTSRDTYNVAGLDLYPNTSDAEVNNSPQLDILSNGFKLRATTAGKNGSGNTMIYACFAETPFRNSLAR
jgi:hypothetical protein